MILILAVLAVGCTEKRPAAVPRRTAYPRAAVYDTVYSDFLSAPLYLSVNAQALTDAEQRADNSYWLTISYPKLNAKVYCTFTPVTESTVESVVDNRAERIHLNTHQYAPTVTDFTGRGGYYSTLVVSPTVTATPVQFMAVNPGSPKWVLSGTAFIEGITPDTPADSIRPTVNALRRDITRMLDSLADR